MSPRRPRLTTKTDVTIMKPRIIHNKKNVLPGNKGSILMPLKMSGRAIKTIDVSIVAIKTPRVVLVRTNHL
jgi:hypothetical protein